MNSYVIFLIIIVIVTLLFKRFSYIKNNKIYLIVIFSLMILFLILRDSSVNIDTKNYKNIFDYCHTKSFVELLSYERHEIGYKYLNKIVSLIWYNYSFLLAIISIISMMGVYYFIKDNSDNYFYTIFIFITFNFYGFFFGILRQVIAISILLLSIKFVRQKKLIPFVLMVILASLFHKTALIFLPIYFIKDIKISKKIFTMWSIGIVFLLIFKNLILSFITKYIYSPASLVANSGSGYKMLVLLLGLAIVAYYYQDKLIKKSQKNQLMINMIFVASLLQIIATVFSTSYRITLYYCFAMIILIPNIIEEISNRKIRYSIIALMLVSLFAYFYLMTSRNIDYIPYKFLF